MRAILISVILLSSLSLRAQSFLRPGLVGYTPMGIGGGAQLLNQNIPDKKWFLSSAVGISTGFSYVNGNNASFISTPVSLQLNRRINKNLYAFAGVTVAPTYGNFSGAFMSADPKNFQGTGMFRNGSLGMYKSAEMGLFYINDAKTFSISGSISVSQNNFPTLPYYQLKQQQQPMKPAGK